MFTTIWAHFPIAQVRSKENLKSRYVHGCITKHDLERLAKNVEQLNQIEPDEPNPKELSTNSEPDADSANELEKVEPEGESNSSEPRIESNVAKPVETTINLELTIPITTPSNINKSKFSTMMDMWKFMQNQQQAYWKYAKIIYGSVRNVVKNFSNNLSTFILEFPYHVFKSWEQDLRQEEFRNSSKNEKAKEQDKRG
ncbi:hypothetical protein J1N35_044334 [Gossypium stocksii]|uniref:Uncharacterized protein n=1 Tax=Gossypium stocksii TaxID=47602 RepID=A0A9D3U968_9ROSI|nr:hypothetical protein J1N35_044334 [Gossypium stocksii]